jgi:hypothetical protein
MVERESYLLELARYVVLNPVRAGIVNDAANYRWSSYCATVESGNAHGAALAWLETDWLLSQFSAQRAEAVARYVDHVRAGVGLPSVWAALAGHIYLGSNVFVTQMQAHVDGKSDDALREVPRLQRRPLKRPLAEFAAACSSRDEDLIFFKRSYRGTLRKNMTINTACRTALRILGSTILATTLCAVAPPAAQAQASGPLGTRTVIKYWIESSTFLSITPTAPFDNPTGCATSTSAIIPSSHPAYKQMMAAVVHAMATNTPISAWASGCFSFWGQSYPAIYAIGVGS